MNLKTGDKVLIKWTNDTVSVGEIILFDAYKPRSVEVFFPLYARIYKVNSFFIKAIITDEEYETRAVIESL